MAIGGFRPGLYKFEDELTGEIYYSDKIIRDWDGSLRSFHNLDGKHPDLNAKVYPNEQQVKISREPQYDVYTEPDSSTFQPGRKVPKLKG